MVRPARAASTASCRSATRSEDSTRTARDALSTDLRSPRAPCPAGGGPRTGRRQLRPARTDAQGIPAPRAHGQRGFHAGVRSQMADRRAGGGVLRRGGRCRRRVVRGEGTPVWVHARWVSPVSGGGSRWLPPVLSAASDTQGERDVRRRRLPAAPPFAASAPVTAAEGPRGLADHRGSGGLSAGLTVDHPAGRSIRPAPVRGEDRQEGNTPVPSNCARCLCTHLGGFASTRTRSRWRNPR